jgi:hypothetical protein
MSNVSVTDLERIMRKSMVFFAGLVEHDVRSVVFVSKSGGDVFEWWMLSSTTWSHITILVNLV